MKIMQNSFIHKFVHFYTRILFIENMFDIWINVLTDEVWTYK
jgi:hypothetical protein